MGIFGFGRYRTVRLKIPRKCEWCEVRHEKIDGDLEALRDRISQLEPNPAGDQTIQLFSMILGLGTQICLESEKGQVSVTITRRLDGILGFDTHVSEGNNRIISDLEQGDGLRDRIRLDNSFASPGSSKNGHSFHTVPSKI